MAVAIHQPARPSGIKIGFSLTGCWADTVSVLLGICSPLLLPAPLLPPSVSSLFWGGLGAEGSSLSCPEVLWSMYKKCAGHAAGKQHQPYINRNGVKAEKEACGKLLP